MAGEPILIVDDTPVNLKLTRILLVNEGYAVHTASSAEEALELLKDYHPSLILADIQLPGMDGLEMTRQIKQNAHTRDITVVALTAFAMRGDEQKAIEAGCEGYITKPIDTRTLGDRIRELLARRESIAPAVAAPPTHATIPDAELQSLRRRFLLEGRERARQLLLDLDGQFDAKAAARVVHQWVGAAGLLGYPALSRLSHEMEVLLLERPVDMAQVRESMTNLLLGFSTPPEALDAPVPEAILKALGGLSVAIVGLPAPETQRLCVALQPARARVTFFDLSEPVEAAAQAKCDLAVIYVPPGARNAWIAPAAAAIRPTVFVGGHEELECLPLEVQTLSAGFLMDSWQPQEALVRLSLAVTQAKARKARLSPALGNGPVRVLVTEGDSAIGELVRRALEASGMECHLTSEAAEAVDAARRLQPQATVLAVDSPLLDGYQVLTRMRADHLPLRVMLLTTHQQENDVIRGFAMGADDYMMKPLNPLELVARLKRLLMQ